MRKILFALSLSLFSLLLTAQTNFKPGIVIPANGDTLKGWIDYSNWRVNPRKIEFRSAPEDKSSVYYTVREIQYFEITGEDAYRRAIVTKDMRPARADQITPETRDTIENDTAFLRILVRGSQLSLFELTDSKQHFYVQETGDVPRELIYRFNAGAELGQVYEQDLFKDQLKKYLPENSANTVERKIDKARYAVQDLSRIVLELNGGASANGTGSSNGNNAMTGTGSAGANGAVLMGGSGRRKLKTEFFGSVGLDYSKLTFSGDNVIAAQSLHYNNSLSPIVSVGLDVLSNRNLNDLTLRVELAYSQHTYKGTLHSINPIIGYQQDETFTLTQKNFSPAVSGLYNFRRSKKIRPYVGAGVALNVSSYSRNLYTLVSSDRPHYNDTTNNYLDADKNWVSVFLRAGVRVDRHWEAGVTGNIIGHITTFDHYTASPRTFSLRVAYFL